MDTLTNIILESGKSAVDLSFYILLPVMAIMLGLMELLDARGWLSGIAKFLSPILNRFGIPGIGIFAMLQLLFVSFAAPAATLALMNKDSSLTKSQISATLALLFTMSQANAVFPLITVGLSPWIVLITSLVGGLCASTIAYHWSKDKNEKIQANNLAHGKKLSITPELLMELKAEGVPGSICAKLANMREIYRGESAFFNAMLNEIGDNLTENQFFSGEMARLISTIKGQIGKLSDHKNDKSTIVQFCENLKHLGNERKNSNAAIEDLSTYSSQIDTLLSPSFNFTTKQTKGEAVISLALFLLILKHSKKGALDHLINGGKQGVSLALNSIPILIFAFFCINLLKSTGSVSYLEIKLAPLLEGIGLPGIFVLPLVTKFIAGGTAMMGVTIDLVKDGTISPLELNRMAGFLINPFDLVGVGVLATVGRKVSAAISGALLGTVVGILIRGILHLAIF